eukprot:COSAG02_NODE_57417_length_280_cov_1.430939_1_plen_20_part_10
MVYNLSLGHTQCNHGNVASF